MQAFEGIEVGAVTVKWVRRFAGAPVDAQAIPHGGAPFATLQKILARPEGGPIERIVATGQATRSLIELPYRAETECIERALLHLGVTPDIVLSLGGETFSVYPMKNGVIKDIVSSSKCAAGTGEFLVQQFRRMGFTLEDGLRASSQGRIVPLASRCSVHCKSDVTHKLNRGECMPGDIARTLVAHLAQRVGDMVESTDWPVRRIVVAGGVALNEVFLAAFRERYKESEVLVLPESLCLEAFGASVFAAELPDTTWRRPARECLRKEGVVFERLEPLGSAQSRVDYRALPDKPGNVAAGTYILGVDAGSTTTKAALLCIDDGKIGASIYLRTLGNPVRATQECLRALAERVANPSVEINQVAVTGSGRELVSVYLDESLSFNEILAHARAAAEEIPDVDTVFEIGGQDSKFISFQTGIPVDYAMNEGCSAGTGSFLEESASVDMGVTVEGISHLAEESAHPIAFGERCAAFINTDLRNALQQGAAVADVVAGLVYSIADNYISRVVGPRPIGKTVLLQGGVALNKSVALAMAQRTQRDIIVPRYPALMGCVGAALMARDRLHTGDAKPRPVRLDELGRHEITREKEFHCKSCANLCSINQITVRGRTVPFGGLCAKYEKLRQARDVREGTDFVAVRNTLMFDTFNAPLSGPARGRIGLPLALTAWELFPFFAKLVAELGYELVLSKPSKQGNAKARAAVCYPCEIAHGMVYDLLQREVDFVLLPQVLELPIPGGALHAYTCPTTALIPDLTRAAFDSLAPKLLSPCVGLSERLLPTTLAEIEKLGARLGVDSRAARRAGERALEHQRSFQEALRRCGQEQLDAVRDEPAVVVAGRPYVICSPDANLSLPRMLTSRGYHAIPMDLLGPAPGDTEVPAPRNIWRFTQQIDAAVTQVKANANWHICLVSCFSCGPDASLYHHLRQRLAGEIFCYLEIDSHTAHTGFETRVGAFLDIAQERQRLSPGRPGRPK